MKICPRCLVEYEKGWGNHCSRSCSNARRHSLETRLKISSSVPKKIRIPCPLCLGPKPTKTAKLCSSCARKDPENRLKISRGTTGKTGGWRNFGGSGKKGTVDGIIYQSSWELAWILYHRDNSISFERCVENFPYEFRGKTRKYYPDFKIGEKYVEVKGVIDEKTAAKFSQFPRDKVLEVFDRNAMKPILDWVVEKYGKEFASVM